MRKRDLLTALLLMPTKKEDISPFLLYSSVVITVLLFFGAAIQSTFIFGIGVLGIVVAPIVEVFFRDKK